MKAGMPSRTSQGNTAVRAREMRRPAEERICSDPFAHHFLSPFYLWLRRFPLVGRAYSWVRERRFPGLRGGILARARYIDESLAASLRDGVEQVVILGAGNDTRGYRLAVDGIKARVFEVDHPSTQSIKTGKVRELFGGLPEHVTYVSIDFCTEDLKERLVASGYDRSKKTFFIWEGVIYYITARAADATLRFVTGNSAPGSTIVFDYFPLSVINGTSGCREADNLRQLVAKLGEPFIFGIDDGEIEPYLRERGFDRIEVSTAADCKAAWFHGVNKEMKVSGMFRMVHAMHNVMN